MNTNGTGHPLDAASIGARDAARFWAKVDAEDLYGCWPWAASLTTRGYGQFKIGGRMLRAHRVAYLLAVDSIPDGMQIDHMCRNRACVNPAHLRPVTNKENHENRAGANRNNRTGVRGVTLTPEGRFRVKVGHHGRRYHGGRFDTLAEAEAAAIALRNRLHTHNDADRGRAAA